MTIIFIVLIAISLAFKYNLSLTTSTKRLQRQIPLYDLLSFTFAACVCVHTLGATESMKTLFFLL